MEYTYKLKSTGDGSAKYGNCEICGKHATEVFHQTKMKEFEPKSFQYISDSFGHKECLERIRR